MCCKKIITAVLFTLMSNFSYSYDLPALNLGFTNFVDGVAFPGGPGWYGAYYARSYNADRLNDKDGHDLGVKGDVDVTVNLFQTYYQSDKEIAWLGGAKPGINFILPAVAIDENFAVGPEATSAGVGDLLIGPWLSFGPYMGDNGPRFASRVEFQVLLPTGKYDSQKELNPGSNFASFNPYWSTTVWLTPKLTASMRLHYLWNAKNDDPNRGFAGASNTRAGQAIHGNYSLAYQATPQMRVSLAGYFLKQTSDTEVDGVKVSGRKEKAFAIGPGLMYSFSKDDHIMAKALFETVTENRPQGNTLDFRYVHHF